MRNFTQHATWAWFRWWNPGFQADGVMQWNFWAIFAYWKYWDLKASCDRQSSKGATLNSVLPSLCVFHLSIGGLCPFPQIRAGLVTYLDQQNVAEVIFWVLNLREPTAFTSSIWKANCHVRPLRPKSYEETQPSFAKRPHGGERQPRNVSKALLDLLTHPACQLNTAKWETPNQWHIE